MARLACCFFLQFFFSSSPPPCFFCSPSLGWLLCLWGHAATTYTVCSFSMSISFWAPLAGLDTFNCAAPPCSQAMCHSACTRVRRTAAPPTQHTRLASKYTSPAPRHGPRAPRAAASAARRTFMAEVRRGKDRPPRGRPGFKPW